MFLRDSKLSGRYLSREPSDPSLIPAYERDQLKLHRLLFKNLPDGVVSTDPHGIITDANPAALELFGCGFDELIGTQIFAHIQDEYGLSLTETIGRIVMGAGSVRHRHVFVKRPDGTIRSCTLCVDPMVEDGELLRAIGIFRDRTELEQLVQIDQKTGLLNETTFLKRAEEQIKQARRRNESLAIGYIDLSGFKVLNDHFGHAEGDRVLKKIAQRLEEAVYPTDFVSRLHGDEFAVLLTRIGRENLEMTAQKLASAVSFEIDLKDPHTGRMIVVHIHADIGIAWREGADIPDARALLEFADKCMYLCKALSKKGESYAYLIHVKDEK